MEGCLDRRVEGFVRENVAIVVGWVELLDEVGECCCGWWGGR